MIKLFSIFEMEYTPFKTDWGVEYLRQHQIEITNQINDADIFLTNWLPEQNLKQKLKFVLKYRKLIPILLWTHEPRYNTLTKNFLKGNFIYPDIHIMNIYNGNIYVNNYSHYGIHIKQKLNFIDKEFIKNKNEKIIGLASYIVKPNEQKLIFNGVNYDLALKRQRLLMDGYYMGVVDVYGKRWPDNIALQNSRDSADWHTKKMDLIGSYKFNICMENTDYRYYVSEKIWDSINSYCLPIYRGSEDFIYEDFPRNSFIDFNDFSCNHELLEYVININDDDYCDRMNRCIEAYNTIFERDDFLDKRNQSLDLIVKKIQEIVK